MKVSYKRLLNGIFDFFGNADIFGFREAVSQ
jgi:hypothetical protein